MRREIVIKVSKILLFLLIFFLINYVLSRLFLQRRLSDSRTGLIDKEYHKVESQVEVLAMGDSHVATGFDPREFKRAFNFSLYGENYIYNYYKLKYVLRRNPRLKVILLPIDLHSFSSWRADRFLHDFYWVKYVNYLQVGWHKKDLLRFIGKYIVGKVFPYLGEYETVFNLPLRDARVRKVPLPDIFQGFVLKTETFHKNREKKTRQRVRLHYHNHTYFDDVVALYFRKILRLCSLYNKQLVLVKFPVSEPYFRHASRQVPVKKLYARVQEYIKPYNNVRILDYQKLFFGRDAPYFDDPDHLNHYGAAKFSQKLRKELEDIL